MDRRLGGDASLNADACNTVRASDVPCLLEANEKLQRHSMSAANGQLQDDCRLPQGQRACDHASLVQFIELCRLMGLLTQASVAIDGSKFKAVNTRDKNFTRGKVERRRAQ